MKIRILDNAKLDLVDGFYFYDEQEESLGQYFLDCLYSDIDSLLIFAGIHRKKYGLFWLLAKRFPYAVYYDLAGEEVQIHAVLDCRQDPKFIEKRIQNERTRRW